MSKKHFDYVVQNTKDSNIVRFHYFFNSHQKPTRNQPEYNDKVTVLREF